MILSLKAGAKVYLNGAVVKVDRKVNIELLNDVAFLLDSHVIQADDAVTPLRQLYFVLQTLLIDPNGTTHVRAMFEGMLASTIATFENEDVLAGLAEVKTSFVADRFFEAMKQLRTLYPIEESIIGQVAMKPTIPTRAA